MLEKRTVHGRAVKQGIVCECCKHQCSMWEMIEYCNTGTPGSGHSRPYSRSGRTPRVMAKKWMSAPDVLNDGSSENIAGSLPDYLSSDLQNDKNSPGIFEILNLFSSPAGQDEYVPLSAGDENAGTEYDLVKEAVFSRA